MRRSPLFRSQDHYRKSTGNNPFTQRCTEIYVAQENLGTSYDHSQVLDDIRTIIFRVRSKCTIRSTEQIHGPSCKYAMQLFTKCQACPGLSGCPWSVSSYLSCRMARRPPSSAGTIIKRRSSLMLDQARSNEMPHTHAWVELFVRALNSLAAA